MEYLAIAGYGFVSVSALAIAYLLGVFSGAHYVPTDRTRVERMLDMAELGPGERLVDIGSGDGRILVAAAARGVSSVGYELNPLLVLLSRRTIRRASVQDLARVRWGDFWRVDLSAFDVVTVYGIPHIMKALEKKLGQELRAGSRVVSNSFPLPEWEGEERGRVFLYVKDKARIDRIRQEADSPSGVQY